MSPAADSIPISSEVGSRIFLGLSTVQLTRENRTVSVPPSSKRVPRYDHKLVDLSTGQAGYGNSTAARLIQRDHVEKVALTADLDTFVEVIHELCKIEPSWGIRSISIGDNPWTDETGISRGFFPLVNCITRRSMLFKFSYVDDQRTARRQLIGIRIGIQDAFVYLFEAQRRRASTGEPGVLGAYRDELPVLLLRSPNWEPIEDINITEMLRDTVANPSKTWPNRVRGHLRDSIDHGNGADTPEKFAERIAMVIRRNTP